MTKEVFYRGDPTRMSTPDRAAQRVLFFFFFFPTYSSSASSRKLNLNMLLAYSHTHSLSLSLSLRHSFMRRRLFLPWLTT